MPLNHVSMHMNQQERTKKTKIVKYEEDLIFYTFNFLLPIDKWFEEEGVDEEAGDRGWGSG